MAQFWHMMRPPGWWRRSTADADWAIDRKFRVRVVKGQWVDPVEHDLDPRRVFLAVIDRLAGRARHVSVATHDAALVREALHRLQTAHITCDVELLYGLPMKDALAEARVAMVPVRFYVPYGYARAPYRLSTPCESPAHCCGLSATL